MKVNWDEIVDYARGVASEEARKAVEADPEAMERVALMRQVSEASRDEAPENFVNRAKALLPQLPAAKVWKGTLAFSSGGAGFRSAAAMARDLRFEFEVGQVELRIEPLANTRQVVIVGLFAAPHSAKVRVTDGRKKEVWCDDDGQFELAVDSDLQMLQFEDTLSGDIYQVDIE